MRTITIAAVALLLLAGAAIAAGFIQCPPGVYDIQPQSMGAGADPSYEQGDTLTSHGIIVEIEREGWTRIDHSFFAGGDPRTLTYFPIIAPPARRLTFGMKPDGTLEMFEWEWVPPNLELRGHYFLLPRP